MNPPNAPNPGNRGRGGRGRGRARQLNLNDNAPAVPPLPPAMMALNPAVQQQMAQQNAFLNMAFGGNVGGMFQAPPPPPVPQVAFAPQNNLAGQLIQAGLVGAGLVVAQAPIMDQVMANEIPEDAPSEDILY